MDDAQALLPAGKLVVTCNGAGYLTSEAIANVDRLLDWPVGPHESPESDGSGANKPEDACCHQPDLLKD